MILELGFSGTEDIQVVGVVLLLWACGFYFLFCVPLLIFCPTFDGISISTKSFTFNLCFPLILCENIFCKICTIGNWHPICIYHLSELNNVRRIWIWRWCSNQATSCATIKRTTFDTAGRTMHIFFCFFLISWSVGRYIMPLSSGLIYVDTVACFSEDNEFNIGCQFLLCWTFPWILNAAQQSSDKICLRWF